MHIVIRHPANGHTFVIGRRTTEIPGRAPIRQWIKWPVKKNLGGFWAEDTTRPQLIAIAPNLDRVRRSDVEQYYLSMGGYEIADRVA